MVETSRKSRRSCLAAISVALALGDALTERALPAWALETDGESRIPAVYAFDVPRGDLAGVVISIARRTGMPIVFTPALVAGHMAGPIQGRHTVDAALSRALAGTGLEIARTPGGSFTIRPATTSTMLAPD